MAAARGKALRTATFCAVFTLLVTTDPRFVRASNDSNSSGEGGSSDESGHSSGESGESSKDSGESSKSTDQESTDQSPEKSTKSSGEGTTDTSTKSKGGKTFSAVTAAVVLGASIVGGIITLNATARDRTTDARTVARFMRENHPLLVRDVVTAEGPLLDTWIRMLSLNGVERARFQATLRGSPHQTTLLRSLSGPIGAANAERFSSAFVGVLKKALGPERTRTIVHSIMPPG